MCAKGTFIFTFDVLEQSGKIPYASLAASIEATNHPYAVCIYAG